MAPVKDCPMLGVYDGFLPHRHDSFTSLTKAGGVATFHPAVLRDDNNNKAANGELIKQLTTCKVCGERMYLVVQAFCPLPTVDESLPHNRMMYVYCCNTAECSSRPSQSWAAFTVQIDEDDDDALNANEDEEAEEPVPMDAAPRELCPPRSFPPVQIDIVDEPLKEVITPTDVEAELIKAAEANAKRGEGAQVTDEDIAELEDQLDLKDKPIDQYFDKFRRRLARCPSQVLRYQSNGVPIFMNVTKTLDVAVPPCERCGGARGMELQVMPTVLYFLHSKQYVPEGKDGDDGVDFATATVYVCSKGCTGSEKGVVVQEEFLFVEPAPTLAEETSPDGKPTLHQYFQQQL